MSINSKHMQNSNSPSCIFIKSSNCFQLLRSTMVLILHSDAISCKYRTQLHFISLACSSPACCSTQSRTLSSNWWTHLRIFAWLLHLDARQWLLMVYLKPIIDQIILSIESRVSQFDLR